LIRILQDLGYPAVALRREALEEELLRFSNRIRLEQRLPAGQDEIAGVKIG
jgi:hypothetical protein